MSLQVWLPLTKDLRQQGLSNAIVTNNGATFNSAGKLGGCYNFTNQNIVVPSTNFKSEFTNNQASLAAWVKVTTSHSAYAQALVLGTQGTSWNNILFGIDINGSGTPIANASTGSAYTNLSFGTAIKDGVWHHIAYTYNAGTMKVYLDGVQKATTTTSNTPAWTNSTNLYIGGNSGGEKFQNGDGMNDVRVYNHCLSPMEVKELAKGLILHYPLNRQGWGQENLLLNSNIEKSGKNTIITYDLSTEGITAVKGATMRISADIKSDVANATIDCYVRSSTSNSMCSNTIFTGIGTTYQRYTMTTVCNTNQDKTPQWFAFRCNGSNGTTSTATFTIKNVKLEIGENTTPWCPNSSDALATTMGLNGTTEYDTSGYCNNGIRMGTFSWTSDTPKYEVSQVFNGTQYIQAPFSCGTISEAVSVAVWGYESNWNTSSAERLIGAATNGSGWCIGDYGSENTLFAFYANGSYNTATGFKQLSVGWHHFVITFDGLNLIYYVDGQEFSKKTFTTKQTATGNYNIEIGRHYGDGCNFKGRMSDVRIYATALSADDVKSLYQNSAYIDSSGNVYGAVHSEV